MQETKTSILIAEAPFAVAMFDTNMCYINASNKWLSDYGLADKNINGLSHYEIFPEIGDEWKAIHQVCMQGEYRKCDEDKFVRLNGNIQWIKWDIRPWYKDDGETGGITMYSEDITSRKKTLELLEETNHVARVGGWEVNLVDNNILWTTVTKEIHEVPPDFEPSLETAINFFKEGESRRTITKAVEEAVANGTAYSAELQIVTAKNREIWVEAKGKAEFINGKCVRIYGTFQDINQRKLSDNVIQQLAAVVDYAEDAIVRTNLNGIILTWNKGAEKIFNYEANEITGQSFSSLIPESHKADELYIQQSIQEGKTINQFETIRKTKEGRLMNVSVTISPIRDDSGNIIAMSRIIRDITEKIKAQQAISDERKLLKTLINNIPLNIYIKDINSKKILVNNKELEFMGAGKEEEILGKDDFELYPYASAIVSIKEDRQVMYSGNSITNRETLNLKRDGTSTWFLTSKIPIRNDYDEISGLLGISYDITDRKLVEEKLSLSEERFRLTFEYSAIGIALLNIDDGGFIDLNSAMASIFGYSKAELMELNINALSYSDDKNLSIHSADARRLISGEIKVVNSNKRYLHKDGHIIWTELVATMVKDHLEKPLYIIFQVKDITSEKEAQQKVQDTLAQLQSVLDAANQVSIIGTDKDGIIKVFNKGAENLLGYTAEEMVGKHSPSIIHDKDEVDKRGHELSAVFNKEIKGVDVFHEYPRRGEFESREWTYIRKDGSRFPVQLVVTAVANPSDRLSFLGIALDITKLKLAEAELENKNKELAAVNTELEQFAYVASHDLQEPLRKITGFISLLESKTENILDDKGKEYLRLISDGATRMKTIISDILDYSRMGNAKTTLVNVNLDALVKTIAYVHDSSQDAIKPVITWDALPEIRADKTAMLQLFSNLINNGIKYQQAGNVPIIKISAEDKNEYWQFAVEDNGIGIEAKDFEKVFVVFQRLHGKKQYSGTGIGLAICKKIVTHCGGDIWIHSTPGNGTTFHFTIRKNIAAV